MPKDTFFNLPPQKRHLIEDVALEEFAAWGFDNASINRIVTQAQIAKGSFYQYFEDKIDLFKYIVGRIGEEKQKFLSPVWQNAADHDFFTLLQEFYLSGLAFAKSYPRAALVGNQVYKNPAHHMHQEIFADGLGLAKEFYLQLLADAIAKGEIRPDIDRRFIAHLLVSLNTSIFEYYFAEVKGDEFNMAEVDDDIMETVNLTLDFIKNGITLTTKELVV